ncbi:ribokinase [Chimaeribacter californicus]|uniref:Ribokinase n=1 Tax=Chimaeribacter californicus TaxID=2060067 RepID=A0A2N5EGL0_9GAMM|nr:PfkB family carbohydrate kinase [Chimaeribacter californicus]PLR41694.1 ribokinase [Chimaeribacter californicus]
MTTLACVGITVEDRLYYLDTLPEGGGKYVAREYQEAGGGPAATAAVAAARLGAQVDFIGRVGQDACGEALCAGLAAEGVSVQHCRRIAGAASGQSAIVVDRYGERMIINFPGRALAADAEWLDAIDFRRYDALLADVRWPEGAQQAMAQARAAGIPTVLDADLTPQPIAPLLALADHAAFSWPALQRLAGDLPPEAALRRAAALTPGTVYVTLGSQGCFWLEEGCCRHQPAFEVEVKDTTGAGDVFHGALAWAIARHATPAEAVRLASAAAALKCTRPGGRAGIADCDQLSAFLSHYV